MDDALQERTERALQEKVFPGCVIGLIRANRRIVLPFGRFTYAEDSPPVLEDTIYDMASVTKSIPIAALALTLIADGKLRLDEKAKTYLPELQHDYSATIENLMRYRVRGTQLSTLKDRTPQEIIDHVMAQGFATAPGKSQYNNLPAFLLGLIIELVTGERLDVLAHRYFFELLGMHDTTFWPADIARIPPTEIVDGEEVRGVVHDESARVFAREGRAVGHAGLFSTAPDMLNFLETLLAGKPPAVADGAQKGLGWQKAEPWFMGTHFGEGAYGKTGFTGTSVAVDVRRGTALAILSNRTYPVRPADAASLTSAINRFRADVADIVFSPIS